jgi:ornithine carbamoyltransferase
MVKHILSDFDLTREEVLEILSLSEEMKKNPAKYAETLKQKTLIMLFELDSLRTRVSFEAGMTQLGGHAIFYNIAGGSFTRSETLADGVKVLNRYVNCIMARVLKQEDIERIAEAATVPVINAMTVKYHPCQTLADLLTIKEYKKKLIGLKIAYVGDGGCNTANSTIIGCSKVGMNVTVVCPKVAKYSPDPAILENAAEQASGAIEVSHDSLKGVQGADVIYTDTWVSAGMEDEKEERMKSFMPYQVNVELVKKAKKDCIIMHCLPAHRGYEITDEVMDAPYSVVFDEAENRMHTEKAILYWLMKH